MHRTNITASVKAALALLLCLGVGTGVGAQAANTASASHAPPVTGSLPYTLQPGDVIDVSVWKEPDLQREVLIRPDGGLSFPLAGEITTTGMTVEAARLAITERLKRYLPNPVVTVAVKTIGGNRIYVLGKVNKAGEFTFSSPVDVMQALSLAGGTTPFAASNDIVILRRHDGRVEAIHFRYGEVERGKDLSQDVLLQSGDTVVVP
jgi:polysaccharide export outer membrane protein